MTLPVNSITTNDIN